MKSTEWRAEKISAHSARRLLGRPGFRCAASGLHTANRLTQIVKGAITQAQNYNGLGQRVKKSVTQNGNTVSTLYAYDESGQLIGEYSSSGSAITEVVYLDGQPVLAIKGSTVYGIQADQLNSPRGLYSFTAKKLIWRWDSAPYGDTSANEDPDGNGTKVTFNWRFPGQVVDTDTGLHYNYFRDYDPITGRYIESDPIGLDGGVNTYGYVGASPLRATDPFGLNSNPILYPFGLPPGYAPPGGWTYAAVKAQCEQPDKCDPYIEYTSGAVCAVGDGTCRAAYIAAGFKEPFFPKRREISVRCLLTFGAQDVAIDALTDSAADALIEQAASRGGSVLGGAAEVAKYARANPAVAVGSAAFGWNDLLDRCECAK